MSPMSIEVTHDNSVVVMSNLKKNELPVTLTDNPEAGGDHEKHHHSDSYKDEEPLRHPGEDKQ